MNYSTLLQRTSTSTPTRRSSTRATPTSRGPLVLSCPDAVGPVRGRRLRGPHHRRSATGHAAPPVLIQVRSATPGLDLPGPTCSRARSAHRPAGVPAQPLARARAGSTGPSKAFTSPFAGSALVYWDNGPVRADGSTGNGPAPLENVAPREGHDPHSAPRSSAGRAGPEVAVPAQRQRASTCAAARRARPPTSPAP